VLIGIPVLGQYYGREVFTHVWIFMNAIMLADKSSVYNNPAAFITTSHSKHVFSAKSFI